GRSAQAQTPGRLRSRAGNAVPRLRWRREGNRRPRRTRHALRRRPSSAQVRIDLEKWGPSLFLDCLILRPVDNALLLASLDRGFQAYPVGDLFRLVQRAGVEMRLRKLH